MLKILYYYVLSETEKTLWLKWIEINFRRNTVYVGAFCSRPFTLDVEPKYRWETSPTLQQREKKHWLNKAALLMWNRLLFIFECENAVWTVTNFRPITKSVAHHWSEKGKTRSGIRQRETQRTKWRSHRIGCLLVGGLVIASSTNLPPNVLPHHCFKTFIKSGMLPIYYLGVFQCSKCKDKKFWSSSL